MSTTKKAATKTPSPRTSRLAGTKAVTGAGQKAAPSRSRPAPKTGTTTPARAATRATKQATRTTPQAVTTKPAPTKPAPTKPAPTKRAPRKAAAATATAASTAASRLVVREDEAPWTSEELAEVRHELTGDVARLRGEISTAESDLADLLRDGGDGAGDDQADAGSKTFEREHEMSIANNARDMLAQAEHALQRIDNGTYGICESCGNPIGKARLQAFPRATLCVSCKQREERR